MTPDFTNLLSALGSILSAIVALMALAYSYHQSKTSLSYAYSQANGQAEIKKYEVKSDYQKTIVGWFARTTEILLELKFCLEYTPDIYHNNKITLLSKLSSQIEIGRLYFPNLDRHDGFGLEKPKAFQGYRNLTLDFLVFSFNIFLKEDAIKYTNHLTRLQREFTSIICEIIDPKDFLNQTKRHSDKFFSHDLSYEQFLDRDPSNIDLFFPRQPKKQ